MISIDNELRRLVEDQHGIATFSQLRPYGYTRKCIQHAIESGQWQQVMHGVYAVNNGILPRPALLVAALLYGGGSAALSHDTSAEEWHMIAVDPTAPIHITVRYGCSAVSQPPTVIRPTNRLGPRQGVVHPGVLVHRSRAIAHIVVATDPPRTTKVDTAIDCAVAANTPREAFSTLIALVTNGNIRLAEIQRRVEQRKPRRYNNAINDAIELLANGVQSVLEFRYAIDVEKTHGLPTARRQRPVIVDGRTLFEDVDYSECGVELIVRLDGREAHSMGHIAFRDRRRENAAELAGKHSLVYGWDETHGTPCLVAAEVRSVLERGGWSGDNPCPNCA